MNEFDVFFQNKIIVDKVIKQLKNLFMFYHREKMQSCTFYIIYILDSLLDEFKAL